MVGGDLSLLGSTSTYRSEDQSFRVDTLDVPAPIQDTDVQGYSFECFMLKANKRWVDELWVFCNDPAVQSKLGVNSEPFRVTYLVTSGQYKNGSSIC